MKSVFIALLLIVLGVRGADGDWSKSWSRHDWSGYQPWAEHAWQDGTLHVFNATARYGFGWRSSQLLAVAAGDEIIVQARVHGKGSLAFQLHYYDASRKWLGVAPHSDRCELTGQPQNREFRLPVGNLKQGVTAFASLTFSGTTGTELFITAVRAEIRPGDYAGDAPFPKHWTAFLPVSPKSPAPPLDRIPEHIDGRPPVTLTLNNNQLEFKTYFPEARKGNCAWVYAEIESDHAMPYSIGAGADYFMALYLNGELLLDTRASGNGHYPPHFSNHVITANLRPGKNLLAIQFLSGTGAQPALSVGGANELRALEALVKVTAIIDQDDYEQDRPRPGNPEWIEDILTDGMESRERFGRYRAGSRITLGDRLCTLPPKSGEALFATGIRLHKLTGEGNLNLQLGQAWLLRLSRQPGTGQFNAAFCHDGQVLKQLQLPESALPMDLLLAVSQNDYIVNLFSIQDSRLRALKGQADLSGLGSFSTWIDLEGVDAVVKNHFVGLARREVKSNTVPFRIDLNPTFDPVAAGWKMTWNDEFDGAHVDWENTWMNSPWNPEPLNRDMASLKDGRLHIRCEWTKTPEGKRPFTGRTVGLYSQRRFSYGYYEAKVRFTRKPGWWAAFWMFDEGRNLSVGGGYELDIFEDYSTRGGKPVIANNLHLTYGPNMRSYGYHFDLPGSLDEFYIVGCKWTPFEFSTYINGRLQSSQARHSPYASVTYDAINHGFGTSTLYLCLSGQAGSSGGQATAEDSEEFLVEYVRAYEYPRGQDPQLQVLTLPARSTARSGDQLRFECTATPSPRSQAAISAVYLFDNGNLLDYRTEPPYHFTVPLSLDFYQETAWGSSGRSGKKPVFDQYPHLFRLAVQDEAGRVAYSEPFPLIHDHQAGEPYQADIPQLPGRLNPGHYNRGGHNIACYKQQRDGLTTGSENPFSRQELNLREAGEWVNYTVEATTAGTYEVTMPRRNYRIEWPVRGMLLVDGVYIGDLLAEPHATTARLAPVRLEAGRHVITLISACTYGLWPASLDFNLNQ